MTDAQINQAIAEACGWKRGEPGVTGEARWIPPDGKVLCYRGAMPDYVNDLNAMHEAERVLEQRDGLLCLDYVNLLLVVEGGVTKSRYGLVHAPARQRAEAFLKTLGAWRDSP